MSVALTAPIQGGSSFDIQTTNISEDTNDQRIVKIVDSKSSFVCLDSENTTEKDKKILVKQFKTTARNWKQIFEDRVSLLRIAIQQETNEEEQKSLREKLSKDLEFKKGYSELLNQFSNCVEKLQSKNRKIVALTGKDNLIQGFCDFELKETLEKVQYVYVHTLFTAPWNLKLHAQVPETHAGLVVKGVGGKLLTEAYKYGQEQGAVELQLKPLGISESYYRDRLKMQEKEDTSSSGGILFTMPIGSTIPAELQY